jgi:hypothetical protein
MKLWRLAALPMALVASQALAGESWTKIGTTTAGETVSLDTNSIRKWIDGLVYFTTSQDEGDTYADYAVDCRRDVAYYVGDREPGWRDHEIAFPPGSLGRAETNMVCAKAGPDPLPGHWVGIGFGEYIDRGSIRHDSRGLAHFTTTDDSFHVFGPGAADCDKRLIYFGDAPGWRDRGREAAPNSFAEAELNFACANVH